MSKHPWFLHYPEGTPHELTLPPETLLTMFSRSAQRFGRRPALYFFGKTLSYRDCLSLIERFAGGLAALKRTTGAVMVASAADKPILEAGDVFYGPSKGMKFPPVRIDQIIGDGETLELGGVTLTAHLTPGHTKGCTTWTMTVGDRSLLYFCSASVAANRLVASKSGPPQYDGIVDDYRATFAKTKDWRPDIFLANHSEFFAMEQKRARRIAGDENAFVDQEGFPALMEKLEAAFEQALAEQAAQAQAK